MARAIQKIIAVVGFVSALILATSAQAQPLKVRISWVAVPNHLPPLFMEKPEAMARLGQSYVIDAVRFPGTPQSVAALAAGDLDIALLTFSSFPQALQTSKLDDLRIVGDEFIDGVAGYYSSEFLVLKEGPVQKIDDLKGKTIAVNARGGVAEVALRAIAKKHGLDEKRDFTVVEIPFADMKAALMDKKVDLISLGGPTHAMDPALRTAARTLFTQRDALGPTAHIWVAREGFLQRNRAALIDFVADALQVRRWFTDPKNHNEAVNIVSRITKQPREQIDPWLFTKDDFYRSPDGVLDVAILQNNIKQMAELGYLKPGLDLRKYQDLSIVKEAGQRLK